MIVAYRSLRPAYPAYSPYLCYIRILAERHQWNDIPNVAHRISRPENPIHSSLQMGLPEFLLLIVGFAQRIQYRVSSIVVCISGADCLCSSARTRERIVLAQTFQGMMNLCVVARRSFCPDVPRDDESIYVWLLHVVLFAQRFNAVCIWHAWSKLLFAYHMSRLLRRYCASCPED